MRCGLSPPKSWKSIIEPNGRKLLVSLGAVQPSLDRFSGASSQQQASEACLSTCSHLDDTFYSHSSDSGDQLSTLLCIHLGNFLFGPLLSGVAYESAFLPWLTASTGQAANGSTPLQAGMKMLPYSLGSSLASMPAAWFMTAWQHRTKNTSGQKMVVSVGLLLSTIGFGGVPLCAC